jgi:hypothetical protein
MTESDPETLAPVSFAGVLDPYRHACAFVNSQADGCLLIERNGDEQTCCRRLRDQRLE